RGRPGNCQRLLRVERPDRSGAAVRRPARGEEEGRRGDDGLRCRLHLRARARHAPDRRRGHRHRPPGHAVDGFRLDPRRDPLPASQAEGLKEKALQRSIAPREPASSTAAAEAPSRRPIAFSSIAWLLGTVALVGALAGQGAVRLFLAHQLGMRAATSDAIGILVGVGLALGGGVLVAGLTRRIGFWELFAGFLLALAAGLFLLAIVGATLAHMLGVGHEIDLAVGWEARVAKSHLRLSRPLLWGLGLLVLGIVPGVVVLALLLRRQRRSPTLIMN